MERQAVEVWKKLLKIFCLMFHVAPTSDHSTFTSSSRYTPQEDCLVLTAGFTLDPVQFGKIPGSIQLRPRFHSSCKESCIR